MATLREIKGRIKSIKNIQQITKAMKMVAAAKMRRAQEHMFAARPYASKIKELIHHLVASLPETETPLLQQRPIGRVTLVVVTADRGLCGGFNSNVIRKTIAQFDNHKEKEISLFCVGKKGYDFFSKRDYNLVGHRVGLFNNLQFVEALEITDLLVENFLSGKTDAVKLIYNEFKNVAQQNLVVEDLLPIQVEPEEQAKYHDYLYEPSEEAILTSLLPRHLRMQIWRAFLESYASEQAARMMAMENATDNASELIDSLTLQFNKARQASITKEILEIVGGAEALKNN